MKTLNTILQEKLGEKIISSHSIGGGCIADSKLIETESGSKYFLKSYSSTGQSILLNESNGLKELAKANTIRVPGVVLCEDSFLLLEFIEQGSRGKNFSEIFGRQFAGMHRLTSDLYGFYENNFIGSNPQKNLPMKTNWTEFYWENRIFFQFKLAEKNGYGNYEFQSLIGKLEKRVDSIIDNSGEHPCVLHGDLWGGNYLVDEKGNPVLIDPAVYYGHREADLGMTALFGGFDSRFYDAYNEAYPLPPGWKDRIDLYKLYHVMNHLNLFGSGYYSHTISILRKYAG